jgi:hypothetical protein
LGEWAKAIQYGEQALKEATQKRTCTRTSGTMYYRSASYNRRWFILEKSRARRHNREWRVVQGLPLDYLTFVIETYSRYGLSLARITAAAKQSRLPTGCSRQFRMTRMVCSTPMR